MFSLMTSRNPTKCTQRDDAHATSGRAGKSRVVDSAAVPTHGTTGSTLCRGISDEECDNFSINTISTITYPPPPPHRNPKLASKTHRSPVESVAKTAASLQSTVLCPRLPSEPASSNRCQLPLDDTRKRHAHVLLCDSRLRWSPSGHIHARIGRRIALPLLLPPLPSHLRKGRSRKGSRLCDEGATYDLTRIKARTLHDIQSIFTVRNGENRQRTFSDVQSRGKRTYGRAFRARSRRT